MNNLPFPYIVPYQNMQPINMNIEEEIKQLKREISILKEKIQKLENKPTKNYLEKEEGKYIV